MFNNIINIENVQKKIVLPQTNSEENSKAAVTQKIV